MTTLIFILGLLLGAIVHAKAQTWSEWFHQRRTRMKYMREQVAALEALQSVTETGYEAAEQLVNNLLLIKRITYQQDLVFFQEQHDANAELVRQMTQRRVIERMLEALDEYFAVRGQQSANNSYLKKIRL